MRAKCVSGRGGITSGHRLVESTIIGGKMADTHIGGDKSSAQMKQKMSGLLYNLC